MPRVLSIQSSVVHGVVGLGAATLPLQLHGWEVAPLATVSFSNHSGYPHRGGAALSPEGLGDLLAGLAANGVGLGDPGAYDAVLTGYVGRAGTVAALADAVPADALKAALAAASLKCGGTPLQRAERLRLLKGGGGLAAVPRQHWAKK